MNTKFKFMFVLGSLYVVGATAAVTATVLTHKKETVKKEEVKKIINLPIPVERVRLELAQFNFSPARIDLLIDDYTKGKLDIYKLYDELEKENNNG